MTTLRLFQLAGLGFGVFLFMGFSCGSGPQHGTSTGGGFPVTTRTVLRDSFGNRITTSPAPGEAVTGVWLSDNSGSVGNVKNFSITTSIDGNAFVASGRINANWSTQVRWQPPCIDKFTASAILAVDKDNGIPWECDVFLEPSAAAASSHFALPNQLPTTLTGYGTFSSTYGLPQLRIYSTTALAASSTASQVASDGSSATFPFPTSSGAALPMGFYSLEFTNLEADGVRRLGATSYLAMGANDTSFVTPYGVAVTTVNTTVRYCPPPPCISICPASPTASAANTAANASSASTAASTTCTTTSQTSNHYPVVTQYSTSQVKYRSHLVTVGSNPTAIAVYGLSLSSVNDGDGTTTTVSQTGKAIVANTGSNSVSIVNLVTPSVISTIAVGAQPVALQLKNDNSVAWVANYGDGTVNEVNLSTNIVTRTVTIGSHPASFAYDSANNILWVGGYNYIGKLDLSSFTVTGSMGTSGQVTSLGFSSGLSELVATVVSGGASQPFGAQAYTLSSSESIQEFSTSSMSSVTTYSNVGVADTYKSFTMGTTLPNVSLLPNGTVVSASYHNSLAVSATPGGFIVTDLGSHSQIMQGSTPTPVRSIGVDQSQGIAYLAVPDSNLLVTVPLQ
jgi:YVTN family beta-propeller protein